MTGVIVYSAAYTVHVKAIGVLSVCSCLHLMLVTGERLVAIKFTMHYLHIVTTKNISGALAREARSGAPWVKECGKLPIRENLVIT